MRNVKRAAASRRMPINMARLIVVPERDMPGKSAAAWPHPMMSASRSVMSPSPRLVLRARSATIISTAPSDSVTAHTTGVRSVSSQSDATSPKMIIGMVPAMISRSRCSSGPLRPRSAPGNAVTSGPISEEK